MKAYVYTDDQINEFRLNPYTYSVSHYQLVFTLEFKQFFYKQMQKPGMTTKKIMRAAGYDPSMFTKSKLDKVRRMVLQEARSETGFRPPRGASDAEKAAAFAAKDLSLQKTEVTLKEMQGRISMLEKELELLKKICGSDSSSRKTDREHLPCPLHRDPQRSSPGSGPYRGRALQSVRGIPVRLLPVDLHRAGPHSPGITGPGRL